MANRYLRGTFTRNAWDFYEIGAAWLSGVYNSPAGNYGLLFRNNGIAQSYIDVFRVEFSTDSAASLIWSIVAPSATYTSIEPDYYFNQPVQLDLGRPPGDMVAYQASPPFFQPILRERRDKVQYDFIELANGGPFLTLPPLYGLAVTENLTAPGAITMTVWYQSITDHTPPAT